jgi:FkbM family methyltransferase
LVNKEQQAIDIGANKGVYTHLLAKLVTFVHAFEPNPKMFSVLTKCLSKNAKAYDVALSNESGSGELLVPMSGRKKAYSNQGASLNRQKFSGEHGVVHIETRTLDKIGFIKIDVEGYEHAVLKGAKETLMRCRPTMLIELEERHTGVAIEKLVEEVEAYDYQAYFLRNQKLTPFTQFGPVLEHRNPEHRINYVNNFIFLPK